MVLSHLNFGSRGIVEWSARGTFSYRMDLFVYHLLLRELSFPTEILLLLCEKKDQILALDVTQSERTQIKKKNYKDSKTLENRGDLLQAGQYFDRSSTDLPQGQSKNEEILVKILACLVPAVLALYFCFWAVLVCLSCVGPALVL